jgi:PKD repeat protein
MKRIFILIFSFAVLTNTAQIDLTSNLVLCMPMNGNANDFSGNNNNGTLVGGVLPTLDRFNNINSAIKFDGINSYVDIPVSSSINGIEANDEVSVTAWCNVNAWSTLMGTNNIYFTILEKYDNTTTDNGWSFGLVSPTFGSGDILTCINGWLGGSNWFFNTLPGSPAIPLNTWHFYAMTFSKSNNLHAIYRDGVLIASTTVTPGTQLINTSSSVRIGFSEVGADEYSVGDIDDVRLYNRALNAQEINALYLQPYSCSAELTPVASFIPSQTVICAGQSIVFRDFSTNNPTSWNWQIPGGLPSNSSLNTPTVTFNSPGIYTISLIASNSAGSSSVSVQTITVNNCDPAPVATFSISRKAACTQEPIVFTDQSANNPTSWNWQMPGGSPASSSISNPTVSYSAPGVYTISLISSNSTGSSNISVQTVSVIACISGLGFEDLNSSNSAVLIYPNPTVGELYIDKLEKDNSILVYNILGQKVSVEQNSINENTMQLSFDQKSYGLYIIKIIDAKGNLVQTSKVLVSN